MPRKKKATFTPKKKKTLVPEPKWSVLENSKSEDTKLKSFNKALDFVHYEIPEREQIHWLKKWIRERSEWSLHKESVILPDSYMQPFAKYGWLAIKLGYVPKTVLDSLTKNLKPLLERAEELRDKTGDYDEPLLPDDEEHPLHPNKVKEWLKEWKSYLSNIKQYEDSKDAKQRMEYQVAKTYVYNLGLYLRTGVWSDSHYGMHREKKMYMVVKSMAYDENGVIKRTKGFYYPDIQKIWEGEVTV